MSPFPWSDVAIILALVLMNGFFAMSEIAIVSARKPRLQAMARAGRAGAATAIALAEEPGRFLSSVQIGITLVGILAGAYSGASLGGPVGERLVSLGADSGIADDLGFAIVIAITTYLSLVIGELIPKQFALTRPEPIAATVAPIMVNVARFAAPVVWLLDRSSAVVLKLIGRDKGDEGAVTAEEVQSVVAEATASGVIEESERAMISGVMRLAERTVRGVMTPRTAVDWLDADASEAATRAALIATPHTRLPVAEGSVDRIIGVVQARDLLAEVLEGRPLDLRALARPARIIPDVTDASDALAVLRAAVAPMALVHDEYGHFEGIVTPADLLAAIAGAFHSDADAGEGPMATQRDDGSWLISGAMPADEMAEMLGIRLPADRAYETAAGFVLARLRHLPETGESFVAEGWRIEVVDLDGRKIDKLLAGRAATAA